MAEQLPQDSKRETDHEAMVRWQGYAREHRSTVNSLFLTYAAALFGLQSSILLSKDVTRVDWSSLFIVAAVAALVSLIAGGIVVVLRLEDARQTARIVRYRIEQESQSQIDALRDSTNKIGAGRISSYQFNSSPSLLLPSRSSFGCFSRSAQSYRYLLANKPDLKGSTWRAALGCVKGITPEILLLPRT